MVGAPHPFGVRIEETDPATAGDDDLACCHAALREQHDELDPDEPFLPLKPWLVVTRTPRSWSRPLWLTAWDPDRTRVLALGVLDRTSTETNRHMAKLDIAVLAPFRRAGIGTALLRRLAVAAVEDGRTLLQATVDERSPGVEVLPRWRFEVRQLGQLSRLATADADRGLLAAWADGPPGYALVAHDGRLPDDLLQPWVDLENAMSTAPRDGLRSDAELVLAERYRAREAEKLDQGRTLWRLAARHRASGTVAGGTELSFMPHHPQRAWTGLTVVQPEHRGHGLGRWMKATLIRRVLDERPEVTSIDTWNARSNRSMIAINEELGFEVTRGTSTWQADAEQLLSRGTGRGPA